MGVFRKEKMKSREIIKELDIRIENFLNSKKHYGDFEVLILTVGCEIATLEIGGYLSPRTIKKIGKHYRKKGYLLEIYQSSAKHLANNTFFIDFDHPEKVEKIIVKK